MYTLTFADGMQLDITSQDVIGIAKDTSAVVRIQFSDRKATTFLVNDTFITLPADSYEAECMRTACTRKTAAIEPTYLIDALRSFL